MNIDILGISELKWTGMGEFNSDEHFVYYCGQEFLRRNGVAPKTVQNVVLGQNLKHGIMISVCFQSKPFYITVIQIYAPTSNVVEAEVELFCDDIQDILELTPPNKCPFHHRGLEYKSRKSRDTLSLEQQNEAGQRLTEFCQENALVVAKTFFQQHKRRLYTWTSPNGQY